MGVGCSVIANLINTRGRTKSDYYLMRSGKQNRVKGGKIGHQGRCTYTMLYYLPGMRARRQLFRLAVALRADDRTTDQRIGAGLLMRATHWRALDVLFPPGRLPCGPAGGAVRLTDAA